MKIWFYGQDDAIDEEGFFTSTPEGERKALAEMGAPLEGVTILEVEPEDRNDTIVSVEATPEFIEWLDKTKIEWHEEE